MKKISLVAIIAAISLIFSMTGFAASDYFVIEELSGFDPINMKYSDIDTAKVVGVYRDSTYKTDEKKASHLVLYNDGTVLMSINHSGMLLYFGGTYDFGGKTLTVTLKNTNNYYGIDSFINEPLSFTVTDSKSLVYTGKNYSATPQTNSKFVLTHADGIKIIKIMYNGNYLEPDVPPVIRNDRTLVPLRIVTEAMGCTVKWNDETKTATIRSENAAVALQNGNMLMSAKKTGEDTVVTQLDSAPVILNGRMLVPFRAVAEFFGATVSWDAENYIVIVEFNPYAEKPDQTPENNPEDLETETVIMPEVLVDTVYIKQNVTGENGTCTLASAAMMLRKYTELGGGEFKTLTENKLRPYAWEAETGLKNDFMYGRIHVTAYTTDDGKFMHEDITADEKKQLFINFLKNRPEGIVVYDPAYPHAVWMSHYDADEDMFYAADPSKSAPEGIISLDNVCMTGETADEKLCSIQKIWYIMR